MKSIFIVLLIAVLGAAAYFYFSKKQKISSKDPRELIAGKWKIDSLDLAKTKDTSLNVIALILAANDSNLHRYQFEIKNGLIVQSLDDKPGDTSRYEFADNKTLISWSRNDTTRSKLAIRQLDSSNLVLQDKDSTVFRFKKLNQD